VVYILIAADRDERRSLGRCQSAPAGYGMPAAERLERGAKGVSASSASSACAALPVHLAAGVLTAHTADHARPGGVRLLSFG